MSRIRNPEIYVKGYSKATTKDDLKNIFRQYGKIICIQYKGPYSFIEFEDYYDAEYAVKEMHDKKIDGGYRLIVEPSGKKKNKRRQRSRSRSKSRYQRRRRRSSSSSSSYSSSSYSSSQSSSYSSSSSSSSIDSDDSRDKKRNQSSPKKQ